MLRFVYLYGVTLTSWEPLSSSSDIFNLSLTEYRTGPGMGRSSIPLFLRCNLLFSHLRRKQQTREIVRAPRVMKKK